MIGPVIKGAMLGISLVLPLGPQNVFILRTGTLERKWYRIALIVFAAALCDALLIIGAINGSHLIDKVSALKTLLIYTGICFLMGFGYKLWRQPVKELTSSDLSLNFLQQLLFCITISIVNPHAIIDTFVVIGAVAMEYSKLERHWFSIGCIAMDFLWFTCLAAIGFFVGKMRHNQTVMKTLNRMSAVIMFYIAADLIYSLFKQ